MTTRNATLEYDPKTVNAAVDVELTEWTGSNLTALCTSACESSLAAWLTTAETQCAGQTIHVGGMRLQATYLPLSYGNRYGLVCLKYKWVPIMNQAGRC